MYGLSQRHEDIRVMDKQWLWHNHYSSEKKKKPANKTIKMNRVLSDMIPKAFVENLQNKVLLTFLSEFVRITYQTCDVLLFAMQMFEDKTLRLKV